MRQADGICVCCQSLSVYNAVDPARRALLARGRPDACVSGGGWSRYILVTGLELSQQSGMRACELQPTFGQCRVGGGRGHVAIPTTSMTP